MSHDTPAVTSASANLDYIMEPEAYVEQAVQKQLIPGQSNSKDNYNVSVCKTLVLDGSGNGKGNEVFGVGVLTRSVKKGWLTKSYQKPFLFLVRPEAEQKIFISQQTTGSPTPVSVTLGGVSVVLQDLLQNGFRLNQGYQPFYEPTTGGESDSGSPPNYVRYEATSGCSIFAGLQVYPMNPLNDKISGRDPKEILVGMKYWERTNFDTPPTIDSGASLRSSQWLFSGNFLERLQSVGKRTHF